MQAPEGRPYGVITTPRFDAQLALLVEDIRRWDEAFQAIDLDLARQPRWAQRIPSTDLYAVIVRLAPPRTVYYTIDDEREVIVLEAVF